MSKVRLTSGGRLPAPTRQRDDVVDRDRLDPVVEPLRGDHRGQPRREVAEHVEGRRPVAEHDGGLEHRGRHARFEQDRGRPRRARPGAARGPRRRGAARRGRRCARRPADLAASEKCVAASRSRSAKSGWSSIECTRYHAASTSSSARRMSSARAHVALGHLDAVDPRLAVHRGAAPGQDADRPALVEQPGDDLAADVAGGSGDEGAAGRGVMGSGGSSRYLVSSRAGGRSRSIPVDHVTCVMIGPRMPPVTRRCSAVTSPMMAAASTSSGMPLPTVVRA